MKLIRDYWPQLLTGLSALGLTVGSLGFSLRTQPPPFPPWHERWEVWLFLSSVVAAIVSIFATVKTSQSISSLGTQVSELKSSLQRLQSLEEEVQQKDNDLCSLHLTGLMRRMGLSNNDRVSIYKHSGNYFYRIGRLSNHPEYGRPGAFHLSRQPGVHGRGLSGRHRV